MLPTPPRNLTDATYLNTKSDQHLFQLIRQGGAAVGLSPIMRGFGDQLSEQETRDLVAYVRRLATANSPSAETGVTVTPAPPASDTKLSMSHLRLSIWPEFDDPRVLVILRGEMTPKHAFPTHITLPLPKGAEIVGAGMVSERNEFLLHPHRIIPGAEQDTLDLNLPGPRFFLEFYYNPLLPDAEQQFTYTLSPTYPIERLEVDIQQPRHATNFTLKPQPMSQTTEERDLRYAWFAYRNVQTDDQPTFQISYTKSAPGPSVAKQQSPPDVATRPLSPITSTLLAFGILIGATAIFSACVWLFNIYQRRHPKPLVSPPPSPHANQPSVSPPAKFCSNCGASLQPEHRFCPACGRQLISTA
jgi:hypothetical protein